MQKLENENIKIMQVQQKEKLTTNYCYLSQVPAGKKLVHNSNSILQMVANKA